jgi:hypothetical protein
MAPRPCLALSLSLDAAHRLAYTWRPRLRPRRRVVIVRRETQGRAFGKYVGLAVTTALEEAQEQIWRHPIIVVQLDSGHDDQW